MTRTSPLIPRADLLAPGARSAPSLSPDGRQIAFVAPFEGVQNIWLAPSDDPAAACAITTERESDIRGLFWSAAGDRLIVMRDRVGSEQASAYAFDIEARDWTLLSPTQEGETRIAAISGLYPDEIVIEINDRDPARFDLWRVNIRTGAGEMIFENNQFTWMHVDRQLQPRMAEFRRDDGAVDYYAPTPCDPLKWAALVHVPFDDEAMTRPFRNYELPDTFGPGETEIYAMDSRGRNTAALVAWDLTTGETRLIAADERADVVAFALDQETLTPFAWYLSYEAPEVRALTDEAEDDFAFLRAHLDASFLLADQSANSQTWILSVDQPHAPPMFWLYKRAMRKLEPLYTTHQALADATLRKTTSHVIKARDGLELVTYVTHAANDNSATVVLIHGGPWIRDDFVFDPWVQFLADRGYNVLRVNYRGSKGFGKAHLNAGDKEWGARMFDDVLDAVDWAIAEGIADPARIALMGASFGGYSVLTGLTREPERFACGIDMFGVSDLESFLETIPPYWKAYRTIWDRRLGNIDDPGDRQMLKDRSPLNHASRIVRPLLISQGGADPRVVKAESDQMAAALDQAGAEISYIVFEDEGHSFYQLDNQLSFFACVEAFLAGHLGGDAEPFGAEIARSRLEAPVGAARIPGLIKAMGISE